MRFTLNYFYLTKRGNNQADYEDAFAPRKKGTFEQECLSLAIADGATESSFASDWAKMLAKDFVKKPFSNTEDLQARTKILSKRWQKHANRRPLPWYAEEKVRLGAFTTLLGLQLESDPQGLDASGRWSAIAIGDSCLFQVRNDDLIHSFPIQKAEEFGNCPALLSSSLACNSQLWENVKFHTSEWNGGDIFLLATDALAYWFLSEHEQNKHPWKILLGISEDPKPSQSFRNRVNDLRKSSKLKNDDITLLLVRL